MISIHVIDDATDKVIERKLVNHCPRKGDQIRIADGVYYDIILVVWCYDENRPGADRVNVGVRRDYAPLFTEMKQ